TITVNLVASGHIIGDDARERIRAIMRHGTVHTKVALADAIAGRGARGFDDTLIALAADEVVDVRCAALRAMVELHDPLFIPCAIDRVGEEGTRPLARQLLVAIGPPALEAIVTALGEPGRETSLRWRLTQLV